MEDHFIGMEALRKVCRENNQVIEKEKQKLVTVTSELDQLKQKNQEL